MKSSMKAGVFSAALLATAATAPAAMAGDARFFGLDNVRVSAGLGHSSIKANELVWDDDGSRLSQLVWESKVPVVTFGIKADLGAGWTLAGNAAIKAGDNGKMKDFDWLEPFATGKGDNDWTHRSVHPNSPLDSYVNIDLAIGRNYRIGSQTVSNIHGGVQYTNAGWNSRGGSYIYSEKGFRDDTGTLPAGERAISYKQSYSGVFIGNELTTKVDNWTLSGLARLGVTLHSKDVDHHWQRNLRFKESFERAAFVVIGGRAEYAFSERTSLVASAQYQKYLRRNGDIAATKISTGASDGIAKDGAAADLRTMTVGLAVQTRF